VNGQVKTQRVVVGISMAVFGCSKTDELKGVKRTDEHIVLLKTNESAAEESCS